MNISYYLPFLDLVTWNAFHIAAALALLLFCTWLGWGIRCRHILIYLLIAMAIYVPSLLLWHGSHMFLIILGGLLCSIIAISIPGILLGKVCSHWRQTLLRQQK